MMENNNTLVDTDSDVFRLNEYDYVNVNIARNLVTVCCRKTKTCSALK